VALRECQHLTDVAGAIDPEGDAPTVEVARQHLAPHRCEQPEVAVAHLWRRLRLAHRLLEQHQLRGTAHPGRRRAHAEVGEQGAARRGERVRPTVESCHRALSRDHGGTRRRGRRHHRGGDAVRAIHADHGRIGIEGEGHVELGMRLGRRTVALADLRGRVVHGALLERDLDHAQARDAAEQSRRQGPAVGLDHRGACGREAGADRGDATLRAPARRCARACRAR
jgi:hypothetical protein